MRIVPLILLAIAFLFMVSFAPLARADTWTLQEPGTTIALPDGFANITFTQTMTFGQLSFPDGHSVTFDGVTFSVQKYPAAYPSIRLDISVWQPAASSGTLIRWTPTLTSGTIVWFNVSGLGSASYAIDLGSLAISSQLGPNVAFSWSSFPISSDFAITVAGIPGGVGGVNLQCSQQYVFLSVRISCSATTGITVQGQLLSWYVNGGSAGTGFNFSATVPVFGINGTATIALVYAPVGVVVYTKTMALDARLNLVVYVFIFTLVTIFVTTRQLRRTTRWKVRRLRPITDFLPGSFTTQRIGNVIVVRGRLVGNSELANYLIKERVARKRS